MKRLITLIALLAVFVTGMQAQIVGANEGYSSNSSDGNLYQRGQGFTKAANSIFFISLGAWSTVGIVIAAAEGSPAPLLLGPLYGAVTGAVVATPFWIIGGSMKKRARSMAYVPIIQKDFPLNDDFTLSTSLGTTNFQNIIPEINGLQANSLSVGLSLNF